MKFKTKRTIKFKNKFKNTKKQIQKSTKKDKLLFIKNGLKNHSIRKIIEDVIYMPELKKRFKTFFTLDYMNYINFDENKRPIIMSTKQLYHDNIPFLIEGYIMVSLDCDNYKNKIYNAYMLESLRICTHFKDSSNSNSNSNSNSINYDLYTSSLIKVKKIFEILNSNDEELLQKQMEIIKQAHTIMKYIAIILGHQLILDKNNDYCENTTPVFEVIKVQMRLYDDFSLILNKCNIKNNWDNNMENRLEYNKMQECFKNILNNSIKKQSNRISIPNRRSKLSAILLYKLDLSNKHKHHNKIPKQLTAKDYSRKDFNNKFIIISSEYIIKDKQIKGLDYNYLIKHLKKYGLEFADFYSTVDTKPAFLWFDIHEPVNTELIRQHYNTMAYVGNNLDNLDAIGDKDNLFFNLKKMYPVEYKNFLADSFLLKKDTKWQHGDIFIARPINAINIYTKKKGAQAAAGTDIIYIVNEQTLREAKSLLNRYDNVLISNYITKPLLFKGLKFHFRILFLVTVLNGKLKTYMLDNCKILTAGKPFVLDKFDDKSIHDTHVGTTATDYIFPEDFTSDNMSIEIKNTVRTELLENMREIMKKVSHIISHGSNRAKLYDNFKNGFEVMGIDMMIRDNLQPVLIECNTKAGFSNKKTEKGYAFQEKIFNFINNKVLMQLFGNSNSNDNINDPDLIYSD